MKAFYASRLSDNISQTPEGYLICQNVPVARTGWQDYSRTELSLDGAGMVHVWRDAAEVFDPATIASFEGKSITDGHPPEFVGPANENAYHRGHAQHIRRGSVDGTAEEVLLADLIIKDANLISKIQAGLREISCGYECEYVPLAAMDYDYRPTNGNGAYAQRDIRGNHIAVVPSGRAGETVCIRDSAEPVRRPIVNLARHIFGLGLKSYAKDAEPEAVANAIDDFTNKSEARAKARNEDDDDKAKDEADAKDKKEMTDAVKRMNAACDAMDKFMKKYAQDDDTKDDEIATDDDDETKDDKHEADDEEADDAKEEDADLIPVATLPSSALPCNPIPGADAMLKYLKSVKPIIAKSKDAKAIKQWNEAYRKYSMKAPGRTKDGYRKLLDRKKPDEVQNAEMRMQMQDSSDDISADFLSRVKPYRGRNVLEVSREREQAMIQAKAKERVN